MKKTLKTILLCCIALIAVMTLGGCGGKGKYDDSISEMRDQFLKGENQRFTVTLIGGYRETPFEIDGVSGEKGEYSLISVTPKSATAYSAIKVILLDEEGKADFRRWLSEHEKDLSPAELRDLFTGPGPDPNG